MNQKTQMTIKEFARLTGIKPENLRFYDRIGLLSPETRGENNYRYYSRHQLNTAYLIGSLRGLGVGIEDIKRYAAQSTPDKTLALFAQQEERIQAEIRHLHETSLIMQMYSDMIHDALAHHENDLFLQEKKAEPIFLCPSIPTELDDDEGTIFSYEYAETNGINLGFPQGTLIAQERLAVADVSLAERYYFKVGSGGNAYKPAGLYAIIYGKCDLWKPTVLYTQLLDFIQQQNLCICGDAYEEYPLGGITLEETDQQCIRIEIPVRKPEHSATDIERLL